MAENDTNIEEAGKDNNNIEEAVDDKNNTEVENDKETEEANKSNLNDEQDKARETWGSKSEFFCYCLGYAVGFGNVWRFPYLVYKNGGLAFLIPYVIMLFCAGLPLFFMEFSLGQYVGIGPINVFPNLAPICSGLGWAMITVSVLVSIYYNIILAWSFFYTFSSFTDVLPWSSCDNDYNSPGCFTQENWLECRNQSLYYYNNTCISAEERCGIIGFDAFNETMCINGTDYYLAAERAVTRVFPSEDYFKKRVLGINGHDWSNMGDFRWELVGCNALAWAVVGACMAKGIKGTGKVVYFTACFPYVILVTLLIRGITLPGASKGLNFYLGNADWSRLTDISVWNDAATQIFYSLGISFGSLITLASYNEFKSNCMRDAMVISILNCLTSLFAGLVTFSILGFLATELDLEVDDVVHSGSGLVFIVYPSAVEKMPIPQLWSVLFFIMFLTLGLGSQFSQVETLTTALYDQSELFSNHKPQVVLVTCTLMWFLGLPMCLEGGILMFELLQLQSASLSVISLAIIEIILVQWIYGHRKFLHHIRNEMGIVMLRVLRYYWSATWCVITPLSLGVIFVVSCYFTSPAKFDDYEYPDNIQVLGYFIMAAPWAVLLFFIIHTAYKKKCKGLWKATEKFCPYDERMKRQLKELNRSATTPNLKSPVTTPSIFASYRNEGFGGYVPYEDIKKNSVPEEKEHHM